MPRKLLPSYRHFRPTDNGCVDLSGKRFYLGKFNSPRSRERYNWLIGEWIKGDRLTPPKPPRDFMDDEEQGETAAPIFIPIARIVAAYVKHLRRTKPCPGGRFKESSNVLPAMRMMRDELKHLHAHDLNVAHLERLQTSMVSKKWSKNTIRSRMRFVRLALRHGAKYHLMPDTILLELSKIDRLADSTKGLRLPKKVLPVSVESVEAILPHASTPIAGLIKICLQTGMRPGEAVIMRPIDIDMSGPVWKYRPARHKTQRLGKDRLIVIGPIAQKIIEPFLAGCRTHAYLFNPNVAVADLAEILTAYPEPHYPANPDKVVVGSKFGLIPELANPFERDIAGDPFKNTTQAMEGVLHHHRAESQKISESKELSDIGRATAVNKLRDKSAGAIDELHKGLVKHLQGLHDETTKMGPPPIDLTTNHQKSQRASRLREIRQRFVGKSEHEVLRAVLRAAAKNDRVPLTAIENDPHAHSMPILSDELLHLAQTRVAAIMQPERFIRRRAIEAIQSHARFNRLKAFDAIGSAKGMEERIASATATDQQ